MPKTKKPTRAFATFGVYRRPGPEEMAILELANEYRAELCASYQEEHEAMINLRNEQFPALYAAMIESERCYAWISRIEKEIKAHHSDVRNRNAVTPEQEEELLEARAARAAASAQLKVERQPWNQLFKDFRLALKGDPDDPIDWKKIKTLDRRRLMYAAMVWPEHVRPYATIWMEHDLRRRELSETYQERGLGYAIRAEIVDASQPKLRKDGPGMRYLYGRPPRPRPWEKLSLQFGGGGLPLDDAFSGASNYLSIERVYSNHKARGEETVCRVTQQIGTAKQPRLIIYDMKIDKPIPDGAVIQRWSLVVRGNNRVVVPILSGMDFTKPSGSGTLYYDLTWTRKAAGVEVCYFWGDHVNEALVLPNWLVDQRMSFKEEQQACDILANAWLTQRGLTPDAGQRQGTDALDGYVMDHADDASARNLQGELRRRLTRALKESQRARRCIEKIYETVTRRVCRLHADLRTDPIDLSWIKRYDTRDLLKEDRMSPQSRERLHALAPGKLKAMLQKYGLTPASDEAMEESLGAAREGARTDLFTSWIAHRGRKTGPRQQRPCHRSILCIEDAV